MSTRTKLLIGTIIIAVVVGTIIFLLARGPQRSVVNNSTAGVDNNASGFISGIPSNFRIPSGDTIQIQSVHGIVTVNNFYKDIVGYEDEFLILAQASDYEITYDTIRGQFYIQVLEANAGARLAGEAALLNMLGVSQSDACRLNIAESGTQPKLSFCSGGAFLVQ